jgi:hypothetical protein
MRVGRGAGAEEDQVIVSRILDGVRGTGWYENGIPLFLRSITGIRAIT